LENAKIVTNATTLPQKQINLSSSEYLLEVTGTIGPFDRAPAGVITSLTFTSNAGNSYGPFGQVRGTSFQVPVKRHGSIVAFLHVQGGMWTHLAYM